MLRVALLALTSVALSGCIGGASSPSSAEASGGAVSSGGSGGSNMTELTGRLGVSEVEGGCPYLETPDGTKYEVIYPAGWTADPGSGALQAPTGAVVPAGRAITVRGVLMTDMVSTCQIGPIFHASEVVIRD